MSDNSGQQSQGENWEQAQVQGAETLSTGKPDSKPYSPRKKRTGLIVGGAVGAVLVAAGTIVSVAVTGSGTSKTDTVSPAALCVSMNAALANTPGADPTQPTPQQQLAIVQQEYALNSGWASEAQPGQLKTALEQLSSDLHQEISDLQGVLKGTEGMSTFYSDFIKSGTDYQSIGEMCGD